MRMVGDSGANLVGRLEADWGQKSGSADDLCSSQSGPLNCSLSLMLLQISGLKKEKLIKITKDTKAVEVILE